MRVVLRAIENYVCSIRCIGHKMRPNLQTVYAQTREQRPPWILLPMYHFSTYNSNLCTLQSAVQKSDTIFIANFCTLYGLFVYFGIYKRSSHLVFKNLPKNV